MMPWSNHWRYGCSLRVLSHGKRRPYSYIFGTLNIRISRASNHRLIVFIPGISTYPPPLTDEVLQTMIQVYLSRFRTSNNLVMPLYTWLRFTIWHHREFDMNSLTITTYFQWSEIPVNDINGMCGGGFQKSIRLITFICVYELCIKMFHAKYASMNCWIDYNYRIR